MHSEFKTNVSVLPRQEYWVSKASANQRKGRAGRTGPGVCFRMYSAEQYDALLDYAVPEIRRVPLESIALQIKCLGLGNPRSFAFVEPPEARHMEHAMQVLREVEAVSRDGEEEVLPLGAVLSQLPVDLPVGKMLILATLLSLEDELLTIAAALSVQSPLQRVDPGSAPATLRQTLVSEDGDPFTLLNAFDGWVRAKASGESGRKWCLRHGLEETRLYEMTRLKDQFAELLRAAGLLRQDTLVQARNRVARSNPDRVWKRRQLRQLQREREQARRRRVLEMEGDGDIEADAGEVGERKDEAKTEPEEVDLKALEFELAHDLNAMSDVSSRDLTRQQVNLIKFALASAHFPNCAIPDPGNANRRLDEAVFTTPHVHQASMHPTSVYGTAPSLLGTGDLLVYSQILETSKPFILNATRCPLLASALLCACCIDTNRACTRILVDNWLEISIPSGKACEKLLHETQTLRQGLMNCLASRLATCAPPPLDPDGTDPKVGEGSTRAALGGEDSDVYRAEALPELLATLRSAGQAKARGGVEGGVLSESELVLRLGTALEGTSVRCASRAMPRSLVLWQLLHPSVRSGPPGRKVSSDELRVAQEDAKQVVHEGRMEASKLQALKGGVVVAPGVRFGSLYDGKVVAGGFNSALAQRAECGRCGMTMTATLEELLCHEDQCDGTRPPQQTPSDVHESELPFRGPAPAEVVMRESDIECLVQECDKHSTSNDLDVPKSSVTPPVDALGHPLVNSCAQLGSLPREVQNATELVAMGGDVLKAACTALGLKCGGTVVERAARLLLTQGRPASEWDENILVAGMPASSRKRKRCPAAAGLDVSK